MATHNPRILMNPTVALAPSSTDDGHGDNEQAKLARMGNLHGISRMQDLLTLPGVQMFPMEIGTLSASASLARKMPILRKTTIHAIFFKSTSMSGTVECDASVGGSSILDSVGITEGSTNWQQLALTEGSQNLTAPATDGTYDKELTITVTTASSSSVANGQVVVLCSFT